MAYAQDELWVTPQWPAPSSVRAVFSTRRGGVSQPPYDSMNLALHVGDQPSAVQANRARLGDQLDARPVFLEQVHGTRVVQLDAHSCDATAADGAFTREPQVACTVMVADCLPILLCDRDGQQVAALHAGWRGLAGKKGVGIVEQGVQRFLQVSLAAPGVAAPELLAWLGPCIGPRAFEVGDAVRAAFVDGDARSAFYFAPGAPGKWWADLPGLARHRLQRQGVDAVYGNDGSDTWCTVHQRARFFSYRRDGVSGRMAACIWLASANRRA